MWRAGSEVGEMKKQRNIDTGEWGSGDKLR